MLSVCGFGDHKGNLGGAGTVGIVGNHCHGEQIAAGIVGEKVIDRFQTLTPEAGLGIVLGGGVGDRDLHLAGIDLNGGREVGDGGEDGFPTAALGSFHGKADPDFARGVGIADTGEGFCGFGEDVRRSLYTGT